MSLNALEIEAVVAELRQRLPGARLQGISAPAEKRCQLELRGRGEAFTLLAVFEKNLMRLHLISRPLRTGREPPAWVMRLRAELLGWILASVGNEPGGRRVWFDFSRRGESKRLALDLFGAGRILLADPEGKVVAAILGRANEGEWLSPPPRSAGGEASRLGESNAQLLSANRLAAEIYQRAEEQLEFSRLAERIEKYLSGRLARLRRLEENLLGDLKAADKAAEIYRQAELLKENLSQVPKGSRQIELGEPSEKKMIVPLDPALSATENMQRLFERAKKLRRASAQIRERLEGLRVEIELIERRMGQLAGCREKSALEELSRVLGLAERPGTRKKEKLPERLPYRCFLSASGKEILVGRSAEENHRLTFHLARGSDLWLHAKGYPGAHVIVRLTPSDQLDEQTLLDAATLAAHYCGKRNTKQAEVCYTRVKYCRPVPRQVGSVSVSKEKTIFIRIDPGRLARLNGSRIKND